MSPDTTEGKSRSISEPEAEHRGKPRARSQATAQAHAGREAGGATGPGATGPGSSTGPEIHRSWQLRRALAAGDLLSLLTALAVTAWATGDFDVGMLFWMVVFSPSWLLVMKLQGLYDHDHRRIKHSTLDEVPALIAVSAIGVLLLDGLLALGPTVTPPASAIVLLGGLMFAIALTMRGATRIWWRARTGPATAVVIGDPAMAELMARRLETHPETRLNVVGYLTPAGSRRSIADDGIAERSDEPGPAPPSHLGSVVDLHDVAQQWGVERVIIADGQVTSLETEWLIGECKTTGLALTMVPRNFTLFGPTIELNRLAELPVLDFRFSPPPRSTLVIKRAMDIAVSALVLTVSAPFLLIAAIAIKIDSRGPVFFRQERAGKDGKPFTMVKLRTMVDDAEKRLGEVVNLDALDEPVFKVRNDPRITRVGRLLRRTSLDEIPQLFNVLRGQMSLVGPRPEEIGVVALYDERQRVRLSVKPGLTGPMQVSGRGNLTFEERLALDRDYLDSISITGDLVLLLLKTPRAILKGDGAY